MYIFCKLKCFNILTPLWSYHHSHFTLWEWNLGDVWYKLTSCKKTSDYILEQVYASASGITEKSHSRFMKYILGVNRKASNIAVMSELERYPIYFSVILSMLKYFHRLNNLSEGLRYDAFVWNKELNSCQTNTWYSSILLILNKMNISNVNVYVTMWKKNYVIVS
jgi:hypothetical protein